MNDDRLERAKEIFAASLEIEADRRDAFLAERCGDDSTLLTLVRELLVHHEDEPGFLEHCVGEDVTVTRGPGGGDPSAWAALVERLAEGTSKRTRYELIGEVARGGMGAILKVRDQDLRRTLAMKVILGQGGTDATGDTPAADPASLGRFLEEAQVTSQLDHPGIVPVHELGVDESGRVYFTMKLVKGEDLRAVFDRVADPGDTEWTRTRALNVALRACEAMAFSHAKGVVHRDLKPANIMVGRFGETYVMDWGLARVLGEDDPRDLRLQEGVSTKSILRTERSDEAAETPDSPLLTMDGHVVGTPVYMPPEQAEGRLDDVGPASDVYAMGAILYQLLTGRMPYVKPGARVSPRTILARVLDGPPVPITSLAPRVPAELVAICEKAMSRRIADRYPAMEALADDLRAYLERRVVMAYRTGPIQEIKSWVRRNRLASAALLLATLALLIGTAVSLDQRRRAVAEARETRLALDDAQIERERARQGNVLAQQNLGRYRLMAAAVALERSDHTSAAIEIAHALDTIFVPPMDGDQGLPKELETLGRAKGQLIHSVAISPRLPYALCPSFDSVTVSPSGNCVAALSDGRIVLWQTDNMSVERVLVPSTQPKNILFTEDERLVTIGSGVHSLIEIWDITGRSRIVARLDQMCDAAVRLDGGSRIACALPDLTIVEVDLDDTEKSRIKTLFTDRRESADTSDRIRQMVPLMDGSRIALIRRSGEICVLDLERGRETLSLGHHNVVGLDTFDTDSLLVWRSDGLVRLPIREDAEAEHLLLPGEEIQDCIRLAGTEPSWMVLTWSGIRRIQPTGLVSTVRPYSPDTRWIGLLFDKRKVRRIAGRSSRHVAAANVAGRLAFFDTRNSSFTHLGGRLRTSCQLAEFSDDCRACLLVGDYPLRVPSPRVVFMSDPAKTHYLPAPTYSPRAWHRAAAMSPSGNLAAVLYEVDPHLTIYSTEQRREIARVPLGEDGRDVVFTKDGSAAVVLQRSGLTRIVMPTVDEARASVSHKLELLGGDAITRLGAEQVLVYGRKRLAVVGIEHLDVQAEYEVSGLGGVRWASSDTSGRVVAAHSGGAILVWPRFPDGPPVRIDIPTGTITPHIAVSPDGSVVAGSLTTEIIFFDPDTGDSVARCRLPGGAGASGMRFSPDGTSLLIMDLRRGIIRVPLPAQLRSRIYARQHSVDDVATDPSEPIVAWVESDGLVVLRDLRRSQYLQCRVPPPEGVGTLRLSFEAGGQFILIQGGRDAILLLRKSDLSPVSKLSHFDTGLRLPLRDTATHGSSVFLFDGESVSQATLPSLRPTGRLVQLPEGAWDKFCLSSKGETIAVSGFDGRILCLDAKTGGIRWTIQHPDMLSGHWRGIKTLCLKSGSRGFIVAMLPSASLITLDPLDGSVVARRPVDFQSSGKADLSADGTVVSCGVGDSFAEISVPSPSGGSIVASVPTPHEIRRVRLLADRSAIVASGIQGVAVVPIATDLLTIREGEVVGAVEEIVVGTYVDEGAFSLSPTGR